MVLLVPAGCFVPKVAPESDEETTTTPPGTTTAADDPTSSTGPLSPGSMDGTVTTEADTSSSSDSTDAIECPAGTCVNVPAGWNGPIYVEEGANGTTASCAGTQVFLANAGLEAEPASCMCECGDPNVSCEDVSAFLHRASSAACSDTTNVEPLAVGSCTDTAHYDDSYMWIGVADPDVSGHDCAPSHEESVPPAGWTLEARGCVPQVAESCGVSGTCIEASDRRTCIWREGDATCPQGDFVEREVVYGGLVDDRSCSACTCGAVEGSCAGTATFYAIDTCGLGVPGVAQEGDCVFLDTPMRSALLEVEPAYACSPGGGEPVGTASATEPVTYCCLGENE